MISDLQQAHFPGHLVCSGNSSCMGTPLSPEHQPKCSQGERFSTMSSDTSVMISDDAAPWSISVMDSNDQIRSIENLIERLGEATEKSGPPDLCALEELLLLFVNFDGQGPKSGLSSPDVFSSKMTKLYELQGYKFFAPLEFGQDNLEYDDEVGSPTASITRIFIFSQHQNMLEMLLSWSRNGFPVGARLLSYASRLAYEARMVGCVGDIMVDNYSVASSDSGMRLLQSHVNGYFCFLNGRTKYHETIESSSRVEKELASKLVDNAFAAYKCFLMYSSTALFKGAEKSMLKLLFSDITSCSDWESKRLKCIFCCVYRHFSDLCIGEEGIMKLLLGRLDHSALVNMQMEIGLKNFSIFGENTETIFHLIKSSLNWGCVEQHKFWGLIRSELSGSKVQVEKVILEFFYLNKLDENVSAIAVEGLLVLSNCCPPTPELVAAIMVLPNNVFQDFAPAVLTKWVVSNASMLFDSLAKFSEKVDSKNGNLVLHDSAEIIINRSAISWLLNYFNSYGSGTDISSNFSISMLCKKAM